MEDHQVQGAEGRSDIGVGPWWGGIRARAGRWMSRRTFGEPDVAAGTPLRRRWGSGNPDAQCGRELTPKTSCARLPPDPVGAWHKTIAVRSSEEFCPRCRVQYSMGRNPVIWVSGFSQSSPRLALITLMMVSAIQPMAHRKRGKPRPRKLSIPPAMKPAAARIW